MQWECSSVSLVKSFTSPFVFARLMYVFKELNVFAQRSWCGGFGGNLVVMLFSGFSSPYMCKNGLHTKVWQKDSIHRDKRRWPADTGSETEDFQTDLNWEDCSHSTLPVSAANTPNRDTHPPRLCQTHATDRPFQHMLLRDSILCAIPVRGTSDRSRPVHHSAALLIKSYLTFNKSHCHPLNIAVRPVPR